jgi:hypothetical protein
VSKSNGSTGSGRFGFTNRGQTVTVIEAPTRYSQRRKAKVAFWVTLFTVGLLTATVASHYWHPILGFLFGALVGGTCGAILFVLIVIWPVLRIIWWWLPELLIGLAGTYGWTWLMNAIPLWLALVLVTLTFGVPAVFKTSRFWMLAPFYCLAVRHRLRTCFAAFIATNREGTLPLILLARPTPAGERVWIWLRPGLSIRNLEQDDQLHKLATACWGKDARVAPASNRYAAFIRVDVLRRDPLTGTVLSNLPGKVPATPTDDTPTLALPTQPPTGVNLADVPAPRKRSGNDNTESRPRRLRPSEPSSPDEYDPSDYA